MPLQTPLDLVIRPRALSFTPSTKQLVLFVAFKGAEFGGPKNGPRPALYFHRSVLKSVERMLKGNLFGLILLISSTFYYFPWDGLCRLPQAKSALLKGRRSLSPASPNMSKLGEGADLWGGSPLSPIKPYNLKANREN